MQLAVVTLAPGELGAIDDQTTIRKFNVCYSAALSKSNFCKKKQGLFLESIILYICPHGIYMYCMCSQLKLLP